MCGSFYVDNSICFRCVLRDLPLLLRRKFFWNGIHITRFTFKTWMCLKILKSFSIKAKKKFKKLFSIVLPKSNATVLKRLVIRFYNFLFILFSAMCSLNALCVYAPFLIEIFLYVSCVYIIHVLLPKHIMHYRFILHNKNTNILCKQIRLSEQKKSSIIFAAQKQTS